MYGFKRHKLVCAVTLINAFASIIAVINFVRDPELDVSVCAVPTQSLKSTLKPG